MRLQAFEAVAKALQGAGVRYLVAGGLAVNAPGLPVRFVSIPTLIHMKEIAGRARDQDDIHHLRMILEGERK